MRVLALAATREHRIIVGMLSRPASPIVRYAIDFWQAKVAETGDVPYRRHIDILDLKPCMGRMLLLDIANPLEDSRYVVFGTMLVEYFNEELTGERLGNSGGAKNRTLIEEYRKVIQSGEAMMFTNDPIVGGSVLNYEKVALPLRNDSGELGFILAVIDQI
jgi:hypothetical protein